jgi:NADH-quinone oxidoreductase subunit K
MNPFVLYQFGALALLGFGLVGLLTRRSLVGMLIGVELMLNGAGLSVVAAARLTPASDAMGQVTALLIMGLAAAEATLVLAIILVVARRFGNTKSETVALLKG